MVLRRSRIQTTAYCALLFASLTNPGSAIAGDEQQYEQTRLDDMKAKGFLSIFSLNDEDRTLAFEHLDKIADYAVVHGSDHVLALPPSPHQIDVSFHFRGRRLDIPSFMRLNHISGLLVLDHGKVALEKYASGRKPSDRWASFSVTKSISSTLIGAALNDGKISSLDDKVTKYIPELQGSLYDEVTIRNLITMTSGADWNENFSDPDNDIVKLFRESFVDSMKRHHRVAPPGTKFLYNTGDASLQTILVERAVGMPAQQYLEEKIWRPFGMESDAHWFSHMGHVMGGANVEMTLRDYGRFGLFFLGGGEAGGSQVLPANWTHDATQRLFPTGFADVDYGYSWWANKDGSYWAIGIFGQAIYINPARQLVIVVNSAWREPDWDDGYRREVAFFGAVEKALDESKGRD